MKTVFAIGEPYTNVEISRQGVSVTRAGIFQRRRKDSVVITSSPCCGGVRQINSSYLGDGSPDTRGWLISCPGCDWHYRLKPVVTDIGNMNSLYAVEWISQGF